MPGLWKAWKPKAGFSLFPRAPWESRQEQARFPHSHSSGDESGWKSGKPKPSFPLSHRPCSLSLKTDHPRRLFAPPHHDIYQFGNILS
jgi:hypothetical protein